MIKIDLDADFISAMKRIPIRVISIEVGVKNMVRSVFAPDDSAWQGHKE